MFNPWLKICGGICWYANCYLLKGLASHCRRAFLRMKNWTIIQRLRVTLGLLIGLSIFGSLLLVGVEKKISSTRSDADHAMLIAQHLRYDLLEIAATVRALLIDPKDEQEARQRQEANDDLAANLREIKTRFGNRPELTEAAAALETYRAQTVAPLKVRMNELLASDLPEATRFYHSAYAPTRQQQILLADQFAARVREVNAREVARLQLLQYFGLALFVGSLVLSYLLSRTLTRAITTPLGRLLAAVTRMGGGDFTSRLLLEQKDEFGQLAGGFDRMGDDLASLISRVQESGIRVNQSITEMAATLREQQATTKEVAATTQEIGATSKEIFALSKTLVGTMGEVVHVAEQTGQSAGNGQIGLERMAKTMQGITDTSATVAEKLAVLNEKAGRINTVVTTINKVADQTNLLSLNAAIEAEKAGEYGLGFAVVAREIRRLADQTAVATYDIERMVKEMESAVNAGVMGMERFSAEVRQGVADVSEVGGQLAQIIDQVQALTPRFEAVNEGMQSQATAAQQISESLTQLSEATQQTAESLEQSNGVIGQLGESARGLHEGVARFKVKAAPLPAFA